MPSITAPKSVGILRTVTQLIQPDKIKIGATFSTINAWSFPSFLELNQNRKHIETIILGKTLALNHNVPQIFLKKLKGILEKYKSFMTLQQIAHEKIESTLWKLNQSDKKTLLS
jgi:hypothetical protein